jgi:type I restriction enzyme S subunit
MREIPFFVPPSDEQNAIVEYVAKDTEAATTAIARTEREIALIQEYRTRLTADIVTGKLDVRPIASRLPEPSSAESDIVPDDETVEDLLEA